MGRGEKRVGRRGVLGREEKGKERGRERWAGLKTRRGKRNGFAFLKLIQTIQFKFKFREFKFNLNNKQ